MLTCFLKAPVYSPQYWVIDALDECNKYQELFTMLRGETPCFPLRIFLTSRLVSDMQRLQRLIDDSASVVCIEIPVQASLDDIRLYVTSRIDGLPVDGVRERAELANTIIAKSNASFLWVRMVMDELENVYSSESIRKVLEGIPEGMLSYYQRTINTMAANTMEKHIAKSVLMWAAVSVRKLTVEELSQALKIDIDTVLLPSTKSAVEGLCGQLVSINQSSSLVDLIHPTARELLLSEAAGEFSVSRPLAHEKIAMTCLRLLSSNEMRPPRNRRLLSQARPPASPFLDYALTQFSEHVASASSGNDMFLAALDRFFKTNALSWIERLAMKGNLYALIRASQNLKSYLDRRAKYQSSPGFQVRNIDGWSADLSRLVTRFGEALLHSPSSIHFLIPPLCPSSSAIHQQFGKKPDGLSIKGRKSSAWDDCIAYVSFGDDAATAVSCGESLIAVGMMSGDVNLYSHHSCQKQGVIHTEHPVDLVHISNNCAAICSARSLALYDFDGRMLWRNPLRSGCLFLASTDDFIVAVSQRGHVLKWDRFSGTLLEDQVFEYRNYDTDTQHNGLTSRVPHVASISPGMDMIALGYRGGAVCLWETAGPEFVDWARDERGRQAAAVLFNPNPNINLLCVVYTDHGIALYDTWSAALVHAQDMPMTMGLLSATIDGRTLVTTDTHGNMRIWDFESLSLLYHVLTDFPGFRILNFASDGSNIVDVMDFGMRIWSPAVLVRKSTPEDASISNDAVQLTVTEGQYESWTASISAVCAHPASPTVIAGKYNGCVVAFDTKDTGDTTMLYSHQNSASVIQVAISRDGVIASGDASRIVQVWGLSSAMRQGAQLLWQIRAQNPIKQLCFSPEGGYLLVSTSASDSVYCVADATCIGSWEFEGQERKMWRWLTIPRGQGIGDHQHFTLLADGVLRSYEASTFPAPAGRGEEIRLQYILNEGASAIKYEAAAIITSDSAQSIIALEVRQQSGFVLSNTTFLFGLGNLMPGGSSPSTETLATTLDPLFPEFSKICKRFIGFYTERQGGRSSLLFVHQNSWLCSIHLPEPETGQLYIEHLFIPKEYLSGDSSVSPVTTANGDVVFCLHDELVCIQNGMKFEQKRPWVV